MGGLTTIDLAKEAEESFQPLLLGTITFPDASVLRLSSHPLNTAEGGYQYNGNDYLARIVRWQLGAIQGASEGGIAVIPRVQLTVADADKLLWDNWETAAGKGFRGAELVLTFLFWEADTATFSSDAIVKFQGVCSGPRVDDQTLSIEAVSKLSLSKKFLPHVPIQTRCPWSFPETAAAKAEAGNPDSRYYNCGYTGVDTECKYTAADCASKLNFNRFGGIQWDVPPGVRSREFFSGEWLQIENNPNEGKYGKWFPLVFGEAWVEAVNMQGGLGTANDTRAEAVICYGEVKQIKRVAVNEIELPPATDMDGNSLNVQDVLFRWNLINRGDRDGAANIDEPYNGNGDTYGSLCCIMWVLHRRAADAAGVARVQALVRGPKFRKVKKIASLSVTAGTCTVTLVGRNDDIASNDPTYPFTIQGNTYGAINGDHTGLTNWTTGPPGTLEFSTGVGNGSGTGGYILYTEFNENPVWTLLEILRICGWPYSRIDLDSWVDTAEYCDGQVPYTDQEGGSSTHNRFLCSLVLRQRRSAADVVNGLLRSFQGVLAEGSASGLLECHFRSTLYEQQPATVPGSNYDTGVSSIDVGGSPQTGYVAYRFSASTIRRVNGRSTLKLWTRSNSDLPNRIHFTFANSERDFAGDAISRIDEADIERMDEETIKGLQIDGVHNLDMAKRLAAVYLAEGLRGNSAGDTRGTIYGELEPAGGFRAVRIRVGHICLLDDPQNSITNQLIRILTITPGANFETCRVSFQFHVDAWYRDDWGQVDDPAWQVQSRDRVRGRPSYPWCPYKEQPHSSDPMYDSTDWTFSLQELHEGAADLSAIAKVSTVGRQVVNKFAALAPPIAARQGTTATTGGTLAGSGRTYYIGVCARDSDGKLSPLSTLTGVTVTDTGSTNTITAALSNWPSGVTGYEVFAGLSPQRLTWQQSGAGTPSSVTVTAYNQRAWGAPDLDHAKMLIKIKREYHAGVWGQPVDVVGASTLKINAAGWTTDEWAGRDVSIIGIAAGGGLAVLNFSVSSNTSDTLTVSPDPNAAGVALNDALIMRSTPSVGSDATGNYVEDAKWVNPLAGDGTGLTPGAEVGRLLRIITGPGAGNPPYRIKSNTTTRIYIEGDWHTTPTSASRYIVEESEWQAVHPTEVLENADPTAEITIVTEVANYLQKTILVMATTMDGADNEAVPGLSAIREMYIYGNPGDVGAAGNQGWNDDADPVATYVPDLANGLNHNLTVNKNLLVDPPIFTGRTSIQPGEQLNLILTWDGVGGHTLSFDSAYALKSHFDYNPEANSRLYTGFVLQGDGTTWLQRFFYLD
jgi:hypothetical protein